MMVSCGWLTHRRGEGVTVRRKKAAPRPPMKSVVKAAQAVTQPQSVDAGFQGSSGGEAEEEGRPPRQSVTGQEGTSEHRHPGEAGRLRNSSAGQLHRFTG